MTAALDGAGAVVEKEVAPEEEEKGVAAGTSVAEAPAGGIMAGGLACRDGSGGGGITVSETTETTSVVPVRRITAVLTSRGGMRAESAQPGASAAWLEPPGAIQ